MHCFCDGNHCLRVLYLFADVCKPCGEAHLGKHDSCHPRCVICSRIGLKSLYPCRKCKQKRCCDLLGCSQLPICSGYLAVSCYHLSGSDRAGKPWYSILWRCSPCHRGIEVLVETTTVPPPAEVTRHSCGFLCWEGGGHPGCLACANDHMNHNGSYRTTSSYLAKDAPRLDSDVRLVILIISQHRQKDFLLMLTGVHGLRMMYGHA